MLLLLKLIIQLSDKFLDEYGYVEFDKDIVRSAVLMERGMTEFQCRHFVSGSQVTNGSSSHHQP